MATRQATFSQTKAQRTQSAVKSDVSLGVAPSGPGDASAVPDVATDPFREFVRALARAAAQRDWETAIRRTE